MRPTYETEEDLAREQEMREHTLKAWGGTSFKVPKKYNVDDYMIDIEGKIWALVEYKNCNLAIKTFPKPIFISAHKIMMCQAYARQAGVPFYIVYRFFDGMYFVDATSEKFDIDIDGRENRNDKQDKEPVCIIPKNKMTEF